MEIIAPGVKIDHAKFNTCMYRSEEQIKIIEQSCCGAMPTESEGYRCNLFGINGITATTCINCNAYHGKKR